MVGPPLREALLPTPVGASRFVTRTTHEQWGWRAPSRGLMAHLVKQNKFYSTVFSGACRTAAVKAIPQ
jgi:hypothetical protein